MKVGRPKLRRGHKSICSGNKKLLVESVYRALLEQIMSGRLPNGTVVNELSLSGEPGVSRTPVLHAVRQLAKDGLVVREGWRRARVAAFSADDIYEIFELRRYLEGPAAELAAGRMDGRRLAPLRAATWQGFFVSRLCLEIITWYP